jgi:type III restriction enzyme
VSTKRIEKLIVNSPFKEPEYYWSYDRSARQFELTEGRRPAGYVIATEGSKSFDDPGIFVEIKLVERIRPRIKEWRENGYRGVSGITKRLLDHWNEPEERQDRQFFFCQLEAMETLIWLIEAPEADKLGIEITGDGGEFERLCSKMATGSGKTVVMSMLIAWQVLNKVTYQQDKRFSKNILIMAPGLTVKSRLKVLKPTEKDNYYEEFNIVPGGLLEKLRQGNVQVQNWHALQWDSEEKIAKRKSVDKRGPKSDEAYVRGVLGDMASARNVIVINDEAHHAWRVPAESKVKGIKKEDIEEATIWISGLDRIHKARGILRCFDFSATPFAPSGKRSSEEHLFPWIVSDFGLNDAIESGLVKTPRVVVRDDSGQFDQEYKSRLYHIYMDPEVKDDINRKAEPEEPLPDLINNAYYLLGRDWKATKENWETSGHKIPPAMITVANTTHTAGRIKHTFDTGEILIPELCNPEKTLQIDSKILDKVEAEDASLQGTKKEMAENLRQTVDTIGRPGKPGEQVQHVISVAMLSEGWDAKTVTHIMGLRAFSSQLLCEQVVGRGLRRVAYETGEDGLFEPEYVNIFGVPFTFMPHEGGDSVPAPPKPKTQIEPDEEKSEFEITWPNVIRIERSYKPKLSLNHDEVEELKLDPSDSIMGADLGAIIEGKAESMAAMAEIDLRKIADEYRIQTILFETTKRIYNQERQAWKGREEYIFAQLIRIVEAFLESEKLVIPDKAVSNDPIRRKIITILHMNRIVGHIWRHIKCKNADTISPVFDLDRPIKNTGEMRTWYTSKPCEYTKKSHINFCVYDSTWEAAEAHKLAQHMQVQAWVKNDHLGFQVFYTHKGVVRKYFPDFLIRFRNGNYLVLEVKGKKSDLTNDKHAAMKEWVEAVNEHKGFGQWDFAVSYSINDMEDILNQKSV